MTSTSTWILRLINYVGRYLIIRTREMDQL